MYEELQEKSWENIEINISLWFYLIYGKRIFQLTEQNNNWRKKYLHNNKLYSLLWHFRAQKVYLKEIIQKIC